MSERHCVHCFDVLVGYLEGGTLPTWPHQDDEYALFVSWKRDGQQLRGCLGTFEPRPLSRGLAEYAIASASRDSRFVPISLQEVPSLHVSVSLLGNFEKARHHNDWEIGRHGITIDFQNTGKTYKATYLPEVPIEQGWSQEDTLLSLIQKSGYHGRADTKLFERLTVTRYESQRASLPYNEYLEKCQNHFSP